MFRLGAVLGATAFLLGFSAGAAKAQVAPVAGRVEQLYAANNLSVPGSLPFHLKIDFELFDLGGKSSAKGTVEEWWASGDLKRVVIKAPWLNEDGTPIRSADPDAVRGDYLVNLLLGAVSYPVPSRTLPKAVTKDQTFGKTVLSCIIPKFKESHGPTPTSMAICTEPGKDVVRYLTDGIEGVTRNSIGTFRNRYVARDVQILFAGYPAINGKLATLQGLDPATVGLVSPPTDAAAPVVSGTPVGDSDSGSKSLSPRAHVAPDVIAGSLTIAVPPAYPAIAKTAHKSGTVLLHAIIGKDGKIRQLVPLASTDQLFTASALEAVRQWVYRPFMLNGEPVEVDTTVTVNFEFGGN
jgi:TonB family protein